MTTNVEQRLREALAAGASAIGDPEPDSDLEAEQSDREHSGRHPRPASTSTRRRRLIVIASSAAAVALIAGVAVAVSLTGTSGRGPSATTRPVPSNSPHQKSKPTSTPTSAAPTAASVLDPGVANAGLIGGGRGYVVDNSGLLLTDDDGASWTNITPAQVEPSDLRKAGVAVQADERAWVARLPKPGDTTVALYRRDPAAGGWKHTSIPLGALVLQSYAAPTISMSFTDADHGWLLVGQWVTHEGTGELLRTTDGGATWTIVTSTPTLPVIGDLTFVTAQVGYINANTAAGERGWWTTADAGRTWTQLRLPVPTAKHNDAADIISTPVLAGNAIVLAAAFTKPDSTHAGVGIYRSDDGGTSWALTAQVSGTPNEQYSFTASPDGSAYVLLGTQPSSNDSQAQTWTTYLSTDNGATFTHAASHQVISPGPVATTGPAEIWTITTSDDCTPGNNSCTSNTQLSTTRSHGAKWQPVSLPS